MLRRSPARSGVNSGPGVERSPEVLWHSEADNDIEPSPVVVDGVVYIGTNHGYLYAMTEQ
jgi:outer membrane protein assembly factor BamB